MFPFRNVLFPTDFTAHARAALKYAAGLARLGGGRVLLFSVQEGSVPANLLTLPARELAEPHNEWLRPVRAAVEELLADPLLGGLEVETRIVEGEPAPEIARAARELEADLVTVVTHGRKGLAHALWGSTAEEIIADAPCPVLITRPPQHDFVAHREGRTEIRLDRLLLATNFRPSCEAAGHTAAQFARLTGAEFHSLYVVGDFMEHLADLFPASGGHALSDLRAYARGKMETFAQEAGTPVQTHVAEGRPYEEIARFASERDADLIVMGTGVHTNFFGDRVLGTEVERVVRNAPCPVLCVPPTR